MNRGIKILAAFFLAVWLWGTGTVCCYGSTEKSQDKEQSTDQTDPEAAEGMLEEIEFGEIQKMVDELLGEQSFSLKEAVINMINGEEPISKEAVRGVLYIFFFSGLENEKTLFFRLLLLVLLAAVLAGFVDVFENGQIGAVSFYVVYLVLFMMLMEAFGRLSSTLTVRLNWLGEFMKTLAPAYFLAVSTANGVSTAAVFYEGVLLLVWMIQWVLVNFLLPGVNLCILLKMVNYLSKEEMLSKMSELLEVVISWALKTLIGLAVGLQVVKNLVAPVMDSLKRTAVGKTAGAIPGIGNAVNAITQLILTSAVLVRNSFGAVILVLIAAAGLQPLIHYGALSLSYRFLAALAQPVSDKRIVGALSTMGEGCAWLLKLLLTAQILCMLAFLVLMAGG